MLDQVFQKKTLRKLAGNSNESVASKPSGFALKHLQKLGWKEGDGLGKNRQGMSEHVRVKKKDDNLGVGCKSDQHQDFENAWWSSSFENALSNFKAFDCAESSDDSDSSDDSELDDDQRVSLERDMKTYSEADRKLFSACGGRRMGQRAGCLQTGKMRREHLADTAFRKSLSKLNNGSKLFHVAAKDAIVSVKEPSKKKTTKKKKCKTDDGTLKPEKEKKKKRKQTKKRDECEDGVTSSLDKTEKKKKKKKRKHEKDETEKMKQRKSKKKKDDSVL